jgi:hypothetical protein
LRISSKWEVDALEKGPTTDVTEPKAKMARISEAPEAEAEAEAVRVPVVWMSEEQVAPVARMY